VVAGEAGEFGVFGPDIFFVIAFTFGAPGEAVHGGAELDGLASAPIADADPGGIFHRFASFRFERLLPMTRHDSGEGIEFEIEIGVAGSDHFVIDEFIFCSEMALEAFFRASNHVAGF